LIEPLLTASDQQLEAQQARGRIKLQRKPRMLVDVPPTPMPDLPIFTALNASW
jgi:hypothetical protein